MRTLYPALQPYANHTLPVGDGHVLHVEESGSPGGLPVVFVHGGPGSGTDPYHRRFFDPEQYRIILFDQRGCGRSTPHAELTHNTTAHLVADMERVRQHLNIERWLLFGGSWGSTLSLVYAQTHVKRVLGLVLRGIFLCRREDIQWFYQSGAHRLYPDYWQDFVELIPANERHDMVSAYHRRLVGEDEVTRMAAAKAWSTWEARCSTLLANSELVNHFGDPYLALSLACIESHYFVHDCFLEHNQILRDADRLRSIPAIIVHGRYDVVCPVEQAWALRCHWPEADLRITDQAGHSASEPANVDALVQAIREMAGRLG